MWLEYGFERVSLDEQRSARVLSTVVVEKALDFGLYVSGHSAWRPLNPPSSSLPPERSASSTVAPPSQCCDTEIHHQPSYYYVLYYPGKKAPDLTIRPPLCPPTPSHSSLPYMNVAAQHHRRSPRPDLAERPSAGTIQHPASRKRQSCERFMFSVPRTARAHASSPAVSWERKKKKQRKKEIQASPPAGVSRLYSEK